MVGKTANILHWGGSWENAPHDSDGWTASFSFSFALYNACEPKGEFDIWSWFTSKGLIHFTSYAISAA